MAAMLNPQNWSQLKDTFFPSGAIKKKYLAVPLGLAFVFAALYAMFRNTTTSAWALFGLTTAALLALVVYLWHQRKKRAIRVNQARSGASPNVTRLGSSRQPVSTTTPAQQVAAQTGTSALGVVLMTLGIVVVLCLLVWFGRAIFGSPPDEGTVSKTTTVVKHQASVVQRASAGPTEAEVREKIRKERSLIEAEVHVLTPVYGERLRWIRVPDGGFQTHFTVDDDKAVGVQCSSSTDEPSVDATGENYECHDGIIARWVRFSAWNADEGPVTVRYQFKYAY